jgi:hypothetical protein
MGFNLAFKGLKIQFFPIIKYTVLVEKNKSVHVVEGNGY